MKYFVDVNGFIWSIDTAGNSNFPGRIQVNEEDVWILGPKDGEDDNCRLIEDEYVLWPSLTSLAMAIEQQRLPGTEGVISLDEVVAQAHLKAESFRDYWINSNKHNPSSFPMSMPVDNTGIWLNQIFDHPYRDRQQPNQEPNNLGREEWIKRAVDAGACNEDYADSLYLAYSDTGRSPEDVVAEDMKILEAGKSGQSLY